MVHVLFSTGDFLKNYTRKNLTTSVKFANKPSSYVHMACYELSTSLEQAVNNL